MQDPILLVTLRRPVHRAGQDSSSADVGA